MLSAKQFSGTEDGVVSLQFFEVSGTTRRTTRRNIPRGFLPTQYCAGGKIEKNEVGGACGAHGGGERCAQGSSGETQT